ncbi:sigma factor [Streptomyces sp. GTA36]
MQKSAANLSQDTFMRALDSLHRFGGPSMVRTWLLRVTRRTVVDNLRNRRRELRLSDTDG